MSKRGFVPQSVWILCATAALLAANPAPVPVNRSQARQTLIQSPLRFEANRGQTDARVKFIARGPGYTMLLADREAVLNLRGGAVRMKLVDAGAPVAAKGLDRLPGVSNYLIGNDPAKWRKDIPAYARVQFEKVYPGIDLIYYGNQRKLEYDFVVAPGGNPNRIRLAFDGARKLHVDSTGDLVIDGPEGEIRQHAPVVYQETGGSRQPIEGRYVVQGQQVAFRLGAYDKKLKLVIDPKLSYSTYIGGTGDDGIFDIAVDSSGYVYATGVTGSSAFPTTTGAYDTSFGPSQATAYLASAFGDAFVTKFSTDGKTLVYSTFLGGNSADGAEAIAIDSSGQVAIIGATASSDYPTKNAYRSSLQGWTSLPTDLVLSVLNASGNALIYSTYFGATNGVILDLTFEGSGIAFDSTGKIVIVGQVMTGSSFPTRNAYQTSINGYFDAFVAKFDPSLSGDSSLIFSTLLGGSGYESGLFVVTDSSNNIYVRGGTTSSNFPTTSTAYQTALNGGGDAFLAKFSSSGSLLYSTYLGGSALEYGMDSDANFGPMSSVLPIGWYSSAFGGSFFGGGLAVDSSGYVYLTGATRSTDFPTITGAYQPTNKGTLDAFLVKLDTTKSGTAGLICSTLLGGSGLDRARAVAVDAAGVIYVHGETKSSNFPVTSDAIQTTLGGGWDLFVSAFSADCKTLLYSTYLGGSNEDQGLYGLKLDGKGGLYIGGATQSSNYPTTTGAYQATNLGGWDGMLTKIDLGPQILAVANAASSETGSIAPSEFVSIYGLNMGPTTGVSSGTEVKGLGNVTVTFGGVEAYQTYASATQINAIAPYKISSSTNLQVTYGGSASLVYPLQVADSAPGIFTQQYGTGQAWVVNVDDWSFNSTTNAAAQGSYIEFWATGQGLVTPESADGAVISGTYPAPTQTVTVLINGVSVAPAWVGLIYTGMIQVNVQIPSNATTGTAVPLQLKIGSVTSRSGVTMAIKAK